MIGMMRAEALKGTSREVQAAGFDCRRGEVGQEIAVVRRCP